MSTLPPVAESDNARASLHYCFERCNHWRVEADQYGRWGVRYQRGDTLCFRPITRETGTQLRWPADKVLGSDLLRTVAEIVGRPLSKVEEESLLDTPIHK